MSTEYSMNNEFNDWARARRKRLTEPALFGLQNFILQSRHPGELHVRVSPCYRRAAVGWRPGNPLLQTAVLGIRRLVLRLTDSDSVISIVGRYEGGSLVIPVRSSELISEDLSAVFSEVGPVRFERKIEL